VRSAALVLLLAGAAARGGVCQAAPIDALPPSALGTFWYTLSVLGSRGGHSQQTLQRVEHDGRAWVESTEHTVLRVKLGAQVLTATRDELRRYDADLRLSYLEHDSDQFGRKTHLVAERRGDRLHLVKESPDGATTTDLPLPADFGHELAPLQALGEDSFGDGWKTAFSTYDTDLGAVDTIEMTVLGHAAEPRPCWQVRSRSAQLKVSATSWVTGDGVLLRQEAPEVMNLRLDLVTEQEALREVAPLLLADDVLLGKELGRPETLQELQLRVSVPAGRAADLFPTTPRQEVRAEGDRAVVTITAAAQPRRQATIPVTAPELAAYLAPSDTAQSADPELQAKAREMVGAETDAWRAVAKIRQWVYRSLRKVDSEPRPVTALEVLRDLSGDCTEHAILTAALCQAVGIPAKMVAGLAYGAGALHYHAWNEVYVGEWVEVDSTWNEALVDAGHLQVAAAALDSVSLARMSLAAGRTLGSLKVEVLDHKTQL
jgi:hypothetical protein